MRTLPLVPACLAVALACLPAAASANTESKPGAKSPASTQAVSKAQRCAELRKKIAAYNEAAKKGGKPAGSETIKQDIAWVKDNC